MSHVSLTHRVVEAQKLWATRAQFLNDGMEIAQAYQCALALLPEFESRNRSGIEAFRKYLEGTRHSAWVFLSSLTERGDELSQWRAYGQAGDSYSLGLDGPALQEAATAQGWRLARCIYDPEEQRRLVREALDRFCQRFKQGQVPDDGDPDPDSRFLRYCYGALLPIAPLIKHHSFEREQEWRLISPVSSSLPIKHRAGAHSLIPYTEFQLLLVGDALKIPETVVGPGASDGAASVDALVSLYDRERVVGWAISESIVPCRNW